MLYYISVALVLLYTGFIALLESFCCAVSPSLCLKFNAWVTTAFVRHLMTLFKSCLGLTLLADNSEKERLPERCVVIANHQSFLDIPVLLAHLDGPRVKFIARAALGAKVPLVTPMLKNDGHCLIAKGTEIASDMQAIEEFAQLAEQNNWIPLIFPEGECSRDGRVGEFHAAGFRKLLESSPLPVAVFAIDGSWKYPDIPELIRKLRQEKGFCRVKLLSVFSTPNGRHEQIRILREARKLICSQIEEWRGSQE